MSNHEDVINSLQKAIDSFKTIWWWQRLIGTPAYQTAAKQLREAYRKGSAVLEHAYVDLDDWREIKSRLLIALNLLGVKQ